MSEKMTRRAFAAGAAALAGTGELLPRNRGSGGAQGANERIRAGFIGVGNRGGQLLNAALPNKDLEVAALCDVYKPYLEQWAGKIGGGVRAYGDFRRLLERKDVDAVFIATPDHWHALMAVMACDAGKDVYVEKPLSLTIYEGRKMVEAARRNKSIVQVGLQRRSSPMYTRLAELVRGDGIGKVTVARCYRITNMYPNGIGLARDSEPPAGLDWDMWLGPSPKRPFNPNIAPYKFRWWKAYSSQIGNWGVHYFDALRWLLGEENPRSVSAHGGKFAVRDSRDIPDTMEAVFEFASGRLLLFGQYEASGAPIFPKGYEVELRGTKGALYAGGSGFEVIPERGGQFQTTEPRMEPLSAPASDRDLDGLHVRNFLDCVKSRRTPNCDVEEGHRSTIFAHLGNIALAARSRIEWDPQTERIIGNSAANGLLHYRYRAPWKLE
jgi:predicted dehydrogenase